MAEAMVRNSSSDFYEAPLLHKPAVNIGDRQKGRMLANSVIQCGAEGDAIFTSIQLALEKDCSAVVNPTVTGDSVVKTIAVLKQLTAPSNLIKNHFFDV